MNKIYRIIWSKTKNCWIVVSEIAKRHGKTAARKGGAAVLGGLVAASLLAGMAVCRPVWAGIAYVDSVSVGQHQLGNLLVSGEGQSRVTRATEHGAFTWGCGSWALNMHATAWGYETTASGLESTAFGRETTASGHMATAFGRETTASGIQATAFGRKTTASGVQATAFGYSTTASGIGATAFGLNSKANGDYSTAFGKSSEAKAYNSLAALGGNVSETAANSAAIGYGASVTVADTVALGSESMADVSYDKRGYDPITKAVSTENGSDWKSTHNAIAVGKSDGSVTRQIIGVAAGTKDTDAVNVAQLKRISETGVGGGFGLTPDDTSKSVRQDLGHTIGVIGDTLYSIDGNKLEDGNILTSVANDKDGNAAIKVELAKDINLGTNGSVTFQKTKLDNTGLYIGDKGPKFTELGADMAGHKITNVADGTIEEGSKDAVNGGQLYSAIHGSDEFALTFAGNSGSVKKNLGETMTIKGTGDGNDSDYSADNIRTLVKDNELIVSLKKDLNVDSVTAGKNGKGGVTISGENGVGTIGIKGNDGVAADITVQNGKNDLNGKSMPRIAYDDGTVVHQVATFDDGLKFKGDNDGVIAKHLNQQLDIKGGANKDALTDNNIGVISRDGTLNVKLAKDLQNLSSVTTNTLTVPGTNGTVVINNDGINAGGKKITNVADGVDDTDAVNLGQLKEIVPLDGYTLAGNSGSFKKKLDDTVTIKGEGTKADSAYSAKNVKTKVDGEGNLVVMLDKDLNVDSVTAGKNGKGGVTLSGENGVGTIGIAGAAGTNGKDGTTTVDISVQKGNNGLNGEGMTRVVYEDGSGTHQVATMDDGMKYGGDSGDVIAKKLNEQLDIKGGVTAEEGESIEDKLVDGNIGVVAKDGVLNVKLAKDINLGTNGSVTMGDTKVDNSGLTIAGGPSVTKSGIDAGSKRITNVANGVNATDAVNVSQLQGAIDNLGEYTLAGNSGTATKKQTDTLTIKGEGTKEDDDQYSGENVKTFVTKDGDLVVKLDKNMVTETVTTNEITTENVITNEITIKGEKGEDGKDANAVVSTKIGEPGLKGGDGITRIFYKDADGNEHQVATFDDGMKYGGDFGDGAAVRLNKTVNVVGEAKNKEDLTDGNIGVIAEQDGDNGKLTVKLNKDIDLGSNGSLTIGDTQLNNNGLTIANGPSVTNTGIDAGGKKITNVANGTEDADAVNYAQLKDVKGDITNIYNTVNAGWELQANGSKVKDVTPNTAEKTGNNVVNFVAGDNVTIVPNTDSTTNASSITISAKNDNVYTTGVKLSEANDLIFTRNDGATYQVSLKGVPVPDPTTQDLRLVGAGDNLTDPYTVDKDHTLTLNIGDPKVKDSIRKVQIKNLATMDDLIEYNAKGLTFAGNTGNVTKKPGETVTIKGEGVEKDSAGNEIKYSGENVRTEVDKDGNLVVKLSENLHATTFVVGEKGDQGEAGTPGEIGLIGPKGEDGKNAEAYISTKIGNPGVDGGNGITRLVYKDENGVEHQVATFDDGLKYGGDSGDVIAKHLNQQLDIKGGAEGALSDNNIGVISRDGVLNVKLAKDINLGTNGSVTMGDTKVDNSGLTITGGPSVTKSGIDAGSNYITNVKAGEKDTDAVNYAQLKGAINEIGEYTLEGNSGTATKKQTDTLTIKGEGVEKDSAGKEIEYSGENVRTEVENGNLIVKLSKNLKATTFIVGEKGDQGEPGEIGLIGPKGEDGADGKNAEAYISTKIGNPGVDGGNGITRLVYKDENGVEHQVATFDDGLKYGGDSGDVIAKHLNQQLDIKGGADPKALTDNNIGVISRDGILNVKLAQDLDGLNSVSTKNLTVPTDNGKVVINKNGIDAGGNKITNVAAGTKDTDAVNYGQIKGLIDGVGANYILAGNSGEIEKKQTDPLNIIGGGKKADNEYSAENIKTRVNDAGDLVVMLDKNIKTDSIVVGPKGENGKDGVTIYAKDGKDGKEGHIGLTGPAGKDGTNATADIYVKEGRPGVDGTDGITRIQYQDEDGKVHEVATFDDGMKFAGDSGAPIAKHLNETLDIIGGSTATDFTDKNIAVISEDGKLKIQMARDLTGLSSVTTDKLVVPTINNPVTIGQNGIDAGGNRITGVRDGRIEAGSTDAVNGGQLYGVSQTVTNINNTVNAGWELQTNGVKLKDVTPTNKVVNIKAGDNVTVSGSGNDVKISAKNTYTEKAELTNNGQSVIFTRTDGSTYGVDIVPDIIPLPGEGDYRLIPKDNDYTKAYEVDEHHTLTLDVTNGTSTNKVKIANLATMDDLSGLIDPDSGETKGLTFEADKGNPAEKKPGDRIAVKGDGNVNTEMDSEGNLKVSLNDEVTADKIVVGPAGADGKDGVTIYAKDGADGKEGHIGLTGPKGADGKDATADISVQDGKPGLNGTDGITRIVYVDEDNQPHEVATFDDGLMFGGDTGNPVAKKLNEQLDIKGGVTDEDKLVDGNIGVVAKDGVLNVKLAKDLKDLSSVTTDTLTVPGASGNVVINDKGINAGGTTIANVAAGKEDTDAVNFSQIKQLVGEDGQTPLGLTFKDSNEHQRSVLKLPGDSIAIKGAGTKLDEKYSAENVKTRIDDNGDLIVMLDKDMTTETITTNVINIYDTNITVKDGKADLDGESIKRIVYEDPEGKEHQVATFDDGLKFTGDDGQTVNRNLNEELKITGGITDDSKLSNDSNIGVVKEGEGLRLKLAKDLKGLNSVEAGGTVLGSQGGEGSTLKDNKGNTVPEGSYLTGLDNTTWDMEDPTFVSGRAATEDQLAAVSQSIIDPGNGGGFGLTAEDGQSVKKKLGATVDVVGDGKNISTKVADGKVVVAMSDSIDLSQAVIGRDGADGKDGVYIGDGAIQGKDGADGKDGISVRGADGTDGVTIYAKDGADGSEGHIGLMGPKGADGKDASADISVKNGKDGLNGETVTRIVYEDAEGQEHRVATMDDGMKFKGDDGTEVAKKLNETLSITGGADKDNLSEDNIGVVADNDGGLNVKLAKDLKGLNSVEAGGTVLGSQGGESSTLKDNKGNAVPEGSYLTGLDNKTWDLKDPAYVSGRAATEDQLAAVSKSLTSAEDGGGFGLTAEDGQSVKKDLGATVDVVGDGKNISTKVADGKVVVAMSDSIDLSQAVIGRDGADGKDGVYIGKDAIQGKDGADGKDGISVRGADGTDGVTIWAKDGMDGADGSEGHIGLSGLKGADGKDATADIYVREGKAGLNGVDGRDGITRVMYDDEDGTQHQVATFDDGLLFGGDTGDTVARNINQQLDVKGGVTDPDKLSDNNIGVVANGKDALNVKLAKDLQGLDSIETKTLNVTEKITSNDIETNTLTVNERLTAKEIGADRMTVKDTLQIGEGANPVTINNDGMDMGGRSITNVAPGEVSATSTDAVNGSQLYQAQQAINQNATNIQNLGNQVNRLSDRVDKAGAGAAALAALHPLDFDPDAKWDVTAGYGHYRGENAAAVGAFYRPDENVMFSVASTVGNGDNMLSAGVTMKIDGKSRMNNSRTAMGKQIIEMRKEMEELRGLIADQAAGRQLDLSKLQLFPDTPENHWAYDYVTTLAGNGLLEGYPDGEFKGRRDLTRYEVAAILYRAMTNGAQLTERALREFAPELNRIRVDTISHHSDGTPSIQRVRVVKGRG